MPRGIARDHTEKRDAIRKGAAAYFAAEGFDRASMAGAARACGVSKALLYHYHDSKDALLFDILQAHLSDLVASLENVQIGPAQGRLRAVIGAVLQGYRDADAEHKLQLEALATLPPDRQAPLIALQRKLVAVMAEALAEVAPELAGTDRLRPLTMSVFGMLNWYFMWHRPGKGISRSDYADLVADLVLGGLKGLSAQSIGGPALHNS